jgi:predicted lipoprotein with Yx(FWY)xxD motif
MFIRSSIFTLAATVAMAASAAGAPGQLVDGALVGANGMTLYTFDNDVAGSGKSVCNGPCATAWPPLMATATDKAEGSWDVITRDDGGKQWSYKGKPLYFYKPDQKPGDRTGDKFRGVWHIITE